MYRLFGGFLQQYFGWRPIFGILLCYNLFAIYISYQFKDDSNAELNEQLNLGRILHSAYDVIKDKTFFKYNMFSALTYAVLMSYLAVASFLFENKVGISPTEFYKPLWVCLCLYAWYFYQWSLFYNIFIWIN